MEFGWLESLMLGIVAGLTELLPVSALAHNRLLMKFMGRGEAPALMLLCIHLGILAAVFLSCQPHILKILRAKSMARIPKRKRKRPLDTKSLMDYSLWQTMILPVILALLLSAQANSLASNFIIMATFLFLNGLILYIPQFLPSSNKDCRSLSRVEGLLMGLGGSLFVIPGFSGTGAALSIASITGVERKYAVSMVLLMQLVVLAGRVVQDIAALFVGTLGQLSLLLVLRYILAGMAAFAAALAAVKLLRSLAEGKGFSLFAYYSWGMALFTFILSLMA